MISTSTRLEGIGEYYFSEKLRELETLTRSGKNIINLGIGNPDMSPHPDVIKTLHDEVVKKTVHGYQSYRGSLVFRMAISEWYKNKYAVNLDPESEILPMMGSKEGIMHICMAWLNAGDQALVPDPGYPTYPAAVKLAGGTAVAYALREENNWYPDFEQLSNTNLSKVKLMFVNYPNMPSGQKGSRELFDRIVRFGADNNILVIHDNPYSFILNDEPLSLLGIDGAMQNVLELNSLSKSHNMAGWRVGMLCGAAENISSVLRFKSNMDSGMFLPVQLAAAKALTLGDDWHASLNSLYAARRVVAWELLDSLNCKYSKLQAGMFVWAKIPSSYDSSYAMSDDILYNKDVFITPGEIFGNEGKKYIRISLCTPEEKILEAYNRIKK